MLNSYMKTTQLNGAMIELPEDDMPASESLPFSTPDPSVRVFVPCLPLNTEGVNFSAISAWTQYPIKVLWSNRIPHEDIKQFERELLRRMVTANYNPEKDYVIMMGPPLGVAAFFLALSSHYEFEHVNILIYKKTTNRYGAARLTGGS